MPLGKSPAPHLRRRRGFELGDVQCERGFPRVLDRACRAPQFLHSLLLPVSGIRSYSSPLVEPTAPLYTCFPSSSSNRTSPLFRLWVRVYGRPRSRSIHSLI